ncbi:hypothetical protein D0N36_19120 [Hymenobacter lapidiphilus]|uniref:SMI1/KNR4 family protein n=1 Tax=Hymenobacter sp. CCM 8763 TaxID=2303334 RepID=UPI000E34DD7E|nr:SMI1/KNR4 family protein [Hymenobacter sp. CCM 8763]RFP63498.1 hypothetical protein D0N36_19120 [Hymenobacter sp. CCM 8763]
MPNEFRLPITNIGQDNWVEKVAQFLNSYAIEPVGISSESIRQREAALGVTLPTDIKEYYLHFGGTDSSDFMYGLQKINQIQVFSVTDDSFPCCSFEFHELKDLVAFALSPANDPLCFDKNSGEIFLLSHDPLIKAKVFHNFSQYLLHELIELEKLEGNGISEEEEKALTDEYLAGQGIDYPIRYMKL